MKPRLNHALFLTGHSGGSGRSFCNANLAVALSGAGLRVLMADLDPLCGSLAFWGELPQPDHLESIQRHSVRPGLDLVLGLEPEDVPELFDILEGQYDVWLFDTCAPLDPALQPVYALCQDVVLLLQNEPLCFRTVARFIERMLTQNLLRPEQFRGLLLNLRERNGEAHASDSQLDELLQNYLLPLAIPYSSLGDRALLEQKTALEFEGLESDFAQTFKLLADMLGIRKIV